MTLLNHPFIRHPALALFLIFCLPAQSLAAVLIECKQHLLALSAQPHLSAQVIHSASDVVPDCHGASLTASGTIDAKPEIANHHTNSSEPADANGCFHCSGVCQNLKPFNLANTIQQAQLHDALDFSRIAPGTATGVSSNPSRPPCPLIPS